MKKPRKKKQKQPQIGQKPEGQQTETVVVREREVVRPVSVEPNDDVVIGELAPVMPDAEEPSISKLSVPVLFIALLGAVLYFSDMYLMEHSGHFNELVYYPNRDVPKPPGKPSLKAQGEDVYKLICSACHQPDGNGIPGQNPPLAGSEWVLAEKPDRIIRIVLNGLTGPIEVKGKSFNNTMLAWKDTLTKDEQVAAVLTYVRQSFGNNASDVTPEQVAPIRKEVESRNSNWTAPELLQIPVGP